MSWYNHPGCSCCGDPFNGGNYPRCNSFGSRNEFVYDPNPNSFDNPPDFPYQSPKHQYETNSCDFCGNDAHYGYDCPLQVPAKVLLLAWDRVSKIKDAFGNKQYKPEDIQELFRKLFSDMQNIHEELAEYINTPSWNRPAFYNNGEDYDEHYTIAITPDFLITDSLIMGDEHLDTIPKNKSDEFIKSSVKNLVLNPSESEDLSDIERECSSIISYPKFDSLLEEFSEDSDPFMEEIDLFLASNGSIPPSIDSDYSNSEGDNIFLERLLHDDPIPLPDILDSSNVV
nr:hypothetical protein [Tanacetum cinerariifolium]